MSRIYDALKRLEAERAGRKNGGGNGHGTGGKGGNGGNGGDGKNGGNGHQAKGNGNGSGNGHGNGYRAHGNGSGNGHGNGHGNGSGNGHGNGHGNGKRRGWRWLFANGNGNGHGNGKLNGSPAINFHLAPDTEDAYQRLGTNLLGGPGVDAGAPPKLLALTASRHGEGTTTTAALFASTLARRRGGRVAVVEANLRSPGFDQVFSIKRNGGFADLVLGQQTLAEVAQATAISGLFAIGCGTTTLAPSTLFDSPGLSQALEQLRSHFDFVVFDTPPVNVYGDSPILCPRLDAAVIVIEADRTRMPEVERTRRTLERVGVRLVGSVLNRRRNYIPAVLEEML